MPSTGQWKPFEGLSIGGEGSDLTDCTMETGWKAKLDAGAQLVLFESEILRRVGI
jgi:hypothetical protein